ncbi:purine and uridine phosphorylase [Aspergillus heterothallicus]
MPISPVSEDYLPQKRPRDFRIAIICALPLEASAIEGLFDKRYETVFLKSPGDSNAYSTGAIGSHDVVLVHMSNMGKVAAATAAGSLRASFPQIQLALVVGICGGVPYTERDEEILLGDVIISEGLVQYDFGRQYSNKRFLRKDTPRDNLPRPRPEIRSILAKLQSEGGKAQLREATAKYLAILRHKPRSSVNYPGPAEDKLFRPGYQHKHHVLAECFICGLWEEGDACDESARLTCKDLGCIESALMPRKRKSQPFHPELHFGSVASGDTVMKSGEVRDEVAARDHVIAFEMEGAGIWEAFPGVLVIKGVCDYADSHKNKGWQAYAASTAASVAAGVLVNWKPGISFFDIHSLVWKLVPANTSQNLIITFKIRTLLKYLVKM